VNDSHRSRSSATLAEQRATGSCSTCAEGEHPSQPGRSRCSGQRCIFGRGDPPIDRLDLAADTALAPALDLLRE